jgi:hypothetical protein
MRSEPPEALPPAPRGCDLQLAPDALRPFPNEQLKDRLRDRPGASREALPGERVAPVLDADAGGRSELANDLPGPLRADAKGPRDLAERGVVRRDRAARPGVGAAARRETIVSHHRARPVGRASSAAG